MSNEYKGKLANITIELLTKEIDGTNVRWELRGSSGEYAIVEQRYRKKESKKTGEIKWGWFDNVTATRYYCHLDEAMEYILNHQLCSGKAKEIEDLIVAVNDIKQLWIDTLGGGKEKTC